MKSEIDRGVPYANISAASVAALAGISNAAFYQANTSKAHVVAALFDEHYSRLAGGSQATGRPVDQLLEHLGYLTELAGQEPLLAEAYCRAFESEIGIRQITEDDAHPLIHVAYTTQKHLDNSIAVHQLPQILNVAGLAGALTLLTLRNSPGQTGHTSPPVALITSIIETESADAQL